jgi:hypothetical protein
MAEKKESKTLEMRVAELEDKISKVHITEDEMRTFQKVSAALGPGAGTALQCAVAQCIVQQCLQCIHQCIIQQCIQQCIIQQCIRAQCIRQCINECAQCGGPIGGGGGGGFGGLGG